MKKRKNKVKIGIHPVMTLLIFCSVVIIVSGILGIFDIQSTFNLISPQSGEYQVTTEAVNSLLNLRGLKYIFTNTVANFASFTVLSNLLILLLGIGIMEKSGFLKTLITLLTKKVSKFNVTFTLVLICIISSITGNLSYLVLIPLSALLFMYGKRNPIIGIITSFAALTCGSGINFLLTSVDSSLLTTTLLNAHKLAPLYDINTTSFIFINIVAVIIVSLIITNITENVIAKIVPKYDFGEEDIEDEIITKRKIRGLLFAGIAGIIYLLIFIYNIIPGLPLSGNLLDYSQKLYIDKLFSYNSFFSNGFVFIVTILFVILGLFYGIGAKTIKNNKDFVEGLENSLNGIGKILVLIFAFSTFISIFKQTNIGNVIAGACANFISKTKFVGLPLILLFYIISIITTLFLPNDFARWPILASSAIPKFMTAGISPEFCQVIFRFGESVTLGIAPIFTFFVVYLAYLEKYNQNKEQPVKIIDSLKYLFPYVVAVFFIYLILIIIWYLIGLPLGISSSVGL